MSISLAGHVGRAVQLLRDRMAESWTTTALARSVAVSRTHLTRLFVACTGFPPMRYLTEIRLTEFTRLIDETTGLACCGRSRLARSPGRLTLVLPPLRHHAIRSTAPAGVPKDAKQTLRTHRRG